MPDQRDRYAKYRLPDGRQAQRKIGPAWTERGRPAPGYYSKRSAEAWLSKLLDEARRGELPGMVQTGATFADAATEYVRWLEHDRQRKPSTLRDYQSILRAHLLPAFGGERLEDITTDGVERWSASLAASGRMNNRTRRSGCPFSGNPKGWSGAARSARRTRPAPRYP